MERKQQFRARIKNINYDYVEDLMIRNDYKNIGETLDIIIKEHEELNDKDWDLEYISDRVATRVNQTFEKELTKIRLGTNNVDRNTQILIELLQGFMQFDDCDAIFTTEMNKPEFLDDVEKLIQKRISEQKQRKHTRQNERTRKLVQ